MTLAPRTPAPRTPAPRTPAPRTPAPRTPAPSHLAVACTAIVLIVLTAGLQAQGTRPASAGNAALRYWMAFAQMRDVPGLGAADANSALGAALAKVEAGDAGWDEAQFGALLDSNRDALDTMMRASRLSSCDWDLEYELGPSAPVAHLPKARTLARLNTLAGLRLAAQGNAAGAVERWRAGVRFATQIAQGGTLISTLSAWSALRSTLRVIERAVSDGKLDAAQRQQMAEAIRALPETGFDWGMAIRNEGRILDTWVARLQKDGDFRQGYEKAVGRAAPGLTAPGAADVAAFDRYIAQAADALGQTPDAASRTLAGLAKTEASLHAAYQGLIPSLARINQTRTEVKAARDKTLSMLQPTTVRARLF